MFYLPLLGALVWLHAFFFFLHDLNVEIYFSAVEGGFLSSSLVGNPDSAPISGLKSIQHAL